MLKIWGRKTSVPGGKSRCIARGVTAAATVCCLALVFAVTPDRQVEAAEDFDMTTWTTDADCSLCHPDEAASLNSAEKASSEDASSSQPIRAVAENSSKVQDNSGDSISKKPASSSVDAKSGSSEKTASAEGSHIQTDMIASTHSLQCTDCHSDTDALTELHVNSKNTTRNNTARLKNPVENEVCLKCHGSYEELAEATKDSVALTDEDGKTVNPHDIPKVSGHDDPVACTSCHTAHKEYDPMRYCTSCHHENVFECNTCHAV